MFLIPPDPFPELSPPPDDRQMEATSGDILARVLPLISAAARPCGWFDPKATDQLDGKSWSRQWQADSLPAARARGDHSDPSHQSHAATNVDDGRHASKQSTAKGTTAEQAIVASASHLPVRVGLEATALVTAAPRSADPAAHSPHVQYRRVAIRDYCRSVTNCFRQRFSDVPLPNLPN